MFDAPHANARPPAAVAEAHPTDSHEIRPQWLALALDHVDYGILLLDADGQVLHANRVALNDLDDTHPLQMLGHALRARLPRDVAPLHDALTAAARRGLQRLINVGDAQGSVSLAIQPLAPERPGAPQATMLLLGKRRVCQQLSIQWFGRVHGLTGAECRVLEALCRGASPREIADRHGVGLATVRTQLGSIRAKTGSANLRALADCVARLPPMTGALPMRRAATIATCPEPTLRC